MIIFVLLYFFWLSSRATRNCTTFVIGYLLFVSNFLGFILIGDILIGGVEYNTLLLNVICLLFAILGYRNATPLGRRLFIFFLIAYAYGILRPVFLGHQSVIMSVKASKAFSYYFFFCYLLAYYNRIQFQQVFNFLLGISIYYSCIYILSLLIPLQGVLVAFAKGDLIQCHYDTMIYLSIAYIISPYYTASYSRKLLLSTICLTGIYIGDYFSLLFCSCVLLVYSAVFSATSITSNVTRILCCIVVALILLGIFRMTVMNSAGFKELSSKQENALTSRDANNAMRYYLISKEPLWGYGFVYRNTTVVKKAANHGNKYAQDLSFIDAGYVDLAGKFGIVGTILFLLYPLFALRTIWKAKTSVFAAFILSFYAINLTYSVFSFQMGITVIGLVIAFMTNECEVDKEIWDENYEIG